MSLYQSGSALAVALHLALDPPNSVALATSRIGGFAPPHRGHRRIARTAFRNAPGATFGGWLGLAAVAHALGTSSLASLQRGILVFGLAAGALRRSLLQKAVDKS